MPTLPSSHLLSVTLHSQRKNLSVSLLCCQYQSGFSQCQVRLRLLPHAVLSFTGFVSLAFQYQLGFPWFLETKQLHSLLLSVLLLPCSLISVWFPLLFVNLLFPKSLSISLAPICLVFHSVISHCSHLAYNTI